MMKLVRQTDGGLVPTPSGICDFEVILWAQFLEFLEPTRGGTIMQGTDQRRKP
jgi:hypothetical protein